MLALHARVKEFSTIPQVILGESMFDGLHQVRVYIFLFACVIIIVQKIGRISDK
jgi:hypothetical protein